jgi:hypothetical protein
MRKIRQMDKQLSAYRAFVAEYRPRQPVIRPVRTVYRLPLPVNCSGATLRQIEKSGGGGTGERGTGVE